jgi:hypothetical protein
MEFSASFLLPAMSVGFQMPYFEFIGEDKDSEAAFSSKYWQIDQVGKKLDSL